MFRINLTIFENANTYWVKSLRARVSLTALPAYDLGLRVPQCKTKLLFWQKKLRYLMDYLILGGLSFTALYIFWLSSSQLYQVGSPLMIPSSRIGILFRKSSFSYLLHPSSPYQFRRMNVPPRMSFRVRRLFLSSHGSWSIRSTLPPRTLLWKRIKITLSNHFYRVFTFSGAGESSGDHEKEDESYHLAGGLGQSDAR